MKKTILTLLILIHCTVFSQNFEKDWKEVIKYEVNGQIKSAEKLVEQLYKKAKRKKDNVQIVRCFFYQSKFLQQFDENAQQKIIANLREEIDHAPPQSAAILNYAYALMLSQYYNQHYYTLSKRTDLDKRSSDDFMAWTTTDFNAEIEKAFTRSLEPEKKLRSVSVYQYKEIFELSPFTDAKNISLFDFLSGKAIDHYHAKINRLMLYDPSLEALYANPATFIGFSSRHLKEGNLIKMISLFQKNEAHTITDSTKSDQAHYKRIGHAHTLLQRDSLYLSSLKKLEAATHSDRLKQQIKADRATFYYSRAEKNSGRYHYSDILKLTDTIFQSKSNPDALADAETIRREILKKTLHITTKKICYPNENLRAFVRFKNVDSVKISYYRLPVAYNKRLNQYSKEINSDSLVLRLIRKNKPVATFYRTLPNKKDYFEYTTEILLEKMDVGNYLIFMEALNPTAKDKVSFVYDNIISTHFNYLKLRDQNLDAFSVMDRKSGKPIENAQVKNDETTITTGTSGKIGFPVKVWTQNAAYYSDLYIIKNNDTLAATYTKNFIYTDRKPKPLVFEAKTALYFDRAIYRPGQKVYYKGILMQKMDGKKSVVPFVSVQVSIEDPFYAEVRKFDIQTNEFGSFSGEFEIPKNTATGQYTFHIDEPDEYEADTKYYDSKEDSHSFWDDVDFDYATFSFQVEEYKRPTFEVQFDPIKENYTLGDTLKITGNAKTLAGSNLTGATVAYSVSANLRHDGDYYDNAQNYINAETKTDKDGNFTIEFEAAKDSTSTEKTTTIHFNVKATVTDTNGETRTANKSLTVGNHTLKLNVQLAGVLYLEDKNQLQIDATTLNDYPINTLGRLQFHSVEKKQFLIAREFDFPEIQTLSREEFRELFPYEPYDEQDLKTIEKPVLQLDFNTEKTKYLPLTELKNWPVGNYRLVATATDSKGNTITDEKLFELASKNKTTSQKEVFTFKDKSTANSGYIEIQLHSVIPNLFITSRMYEGESLVNELGIQLKDGTATLKINKNAYKNLNFHFSSFWENQYAEKTHRVPFEVIQTKLDLEIVSLRNKIEPGSKESWSFRIKDNKQEAEFLASMYDASLDQFKKAAWAGITFSEYDFPDYPDYSHYNKTYLHFNDFYIPTKYHKEYIRDPELYWFGFDFIHPKNSYSAKYYLERATAIATIPSNAKKITGIVSDNSGPLPGANVVVKGTTRGVQTDLDGYFEIDAGKGEELVFSFIGLRDKTLRPIGKNLNVVLDDEAAQLNEVVVLGYDITSTKAKTTASTTVVSSETFKNTPMSRIIETLQGQVPGLTIGMAAGAPGSGRITIRGLSSLNGKKNLLYVIDGVPMTEEFFLELDTNNIEDVTLLKDASAIALYGSRGANGVIVISTKSALKELTKVKTRTNFNETAFFYPHLVTDKDGKINFSFTAPESLTKWSLRLYAHNKKAESGYLQTDVISQKDLMVMPNMPRFVREKDSINISAKVVNMTAEAKSGMAMLLLYDAASGKTIDSLSLNASNTRNFSCKPKESIALNWLVYIPEKLHGLQYKIVAKSGNFSDGEENILPVLSNKILLTESIPLWVKGNTKKEYTFENFKNNTSPTLQHHSMTLEYTSNPVWLAIQSLPYLMEYEHECAEQTFARYYANCIATEILNSNPKIAGLFDSWRKQGSAKPKLMMNEELKSVVIAETPWLLDAQGEEEKNKRMALLFDLATLKESSDKTLKKLEDKMLPSGGFAWFDGGMESSFISQHILAGIGHLRTLFPGNANTYDKIVSQGVPNMDRKFTAVHTAKNKPIATQYGDLHYLYARSFYLKQFPLPKKTDSLAVAHIQLLKKDWLDHSLYQKGLLALVMHRYNEKDFARKITTHLKETAANTTDNGMYWIENTSSYYWYQAPIETQALLIEAFSEIENDAEAIDAMKVWLIKNKQAKNWPTTKATTEAVHALLLRGSDWISVKDNTKIRIGNEKIVTKKLSEKEKEAHAGYIKLDWSAAEMDPKMYSISIDNKSEVPGFGGVYWQYFENLENIKTDSTAVLSIDKQVYKKIQTPEGEKLSRLTDEKIKVGDLLTIRLIVRSANQLEYVHLKDLRASCLEPVDVISGYRSTGNASYYRSMKDVATHFFFDLINKGTYVLEYDLRVNNAGAFNDGIATIQSMYAPEFSAHSTSTRIISGN